MMESGLIFPNRQWLSQNKTRAKKDTDPIDWAGTASAYRVSKKPAKKIVLVFPLPPVPQTDSGGWVEYTKAQE